ncbi:hypothetical protein PSHT_10945 [Puccinia striiformis]|uniref:Small ribosomal subunit protein uS5m n=1 Tax=Puccinia striiformis TaxID=27350 RepID=A0A2S4V6F5_9BASI|nr:hypothetical protein PSHT_10945 [Puccinia striiformis]
MSNVVVRPAQLRHTLRTKPSARCSSTLVPKDTESTTTPAEPSRAKSKYEVDISLFSHLLDPHPSESGPYHQIFFGSKPPYKPYQMKSKLMKFTLVTKRVVNQTGKGKIPSMYTLVVVGNGKGLVGCGEGKSERMGDAAASATKQAIKSLAPVNIFEGRTIHSELRSKFHATEIVMRPRPPVTRSNNPMNVIKMCLMMLQSGGSPIGMGDGFGGRGKRLEKGIGMRTGEELAMMRGRRCEPWSIEDID